MSFVMGSFFSSSSSSRLPLAQHAAAVLFIMHVLCVQALSFQFDSFSFGSIFDVFEMCVQMCAAMCVCLFFISTSFPFFAFTF